MERVLLKKKGKNSNGASLDAILQSRIRCTIDKQWDWGNSPMEDFLYKYRGVVREEIRKKTSSLISAVKWDGVKGSISVKGFMSLIPVDYSKWCNRRRGKNKTNCLARPEINTMNETLKKWVEFTFDKNPNELNRWWIGQSAFVNRLVSDLSMGIISNHYDNKGKNVVEDKPNEQKLDVNITETNTGLQENLISIGGGKKTKNSRKNKN